MNSMTDWNAWHADYTDPSSLLSERLRVIQRHIHDWLDETAPNPVTSAVWACPASRSGALMRDTAAPTPEPSRPI